MLYSSTTSKIKKGNVEWVHRFICLKTRVLYEDVFKFKSRDTSDR